MFKNIHLSYYFFSQEDGIMYHFDREYNRRNTECVKWDVMSEDILPMWIADMDFEAPAPIYEAFVKRANHHVYAYSKLSNEYYQAVIDFMQRRHNFHVEKDWIVFTPGVVIALTLGVQAVTEPGEEVMILSPVYGPFRGATTACSRKLIESPLVNNDGYYTIDFDDMEKRITPNTKAFMLCSPHNPVGRVWTKEELTKIAQFCLKHNLYLIADEIHNDLVFKDHIVMNNISDELAEKTILCTAPSKTFNLAGLQASNIIIKNEELRNKFKTLLGNLHVGSANAFVDSVVIAAYTQCDQWLDELNEYIKGNLEYFAKEINSIAPLKMHVPEGTYLAWVDCRGLKMTDEELTAFFKEKCHLAFNGGTFFGPEGSGFVRANMACPRSYVEEAVKRIKAGVASL